MGLFSSASFDPVKDLPDLRGKVAIVTGANAGIGLYTVFHLARKGATVYLGARSQTKADQAIQRLREEGLDKSAGEIKWINVNLSDPREAKKAAQWFYTQESKLNILINNAGKIISPHGFTPDNISDSVMINHISPFVFTQTLLPMMEKTSEAGEDVRIVNLSSMAHRWVSNPRYDTLERLNSDFSHARNPKTSLYAYTKLANILYARELQHRLDKKGSDIIVTSVHPGSVLSEGNVNLFSSLFCGWFLVWLASLFFVTSSVGAYPSVFAAASPEVRRRREHFKGQYIVPGNKIEETSKDGKNMELAAELWNTTETVLKKLGV